jgi:hypothetical protein
VTETSSLAGEIRAWLARYLANEITLDDFEDWFMPATWHVDTTADPAAAELADAVSWHLGEFAGGETNEAQLRAALLPWSAPR